MRPHSPDYPNDEDYHLMSIQNTSGETIGFVDPNGQLARDAKPVYQLNGRNITSGVFTKDLQFSTFTKRTFVLFAGKSYVEVDPNYVEGQSEPLFNKMTKFEVKDLSKSYSLS